MKILAPIHEGADQQFLPGPGDDVRVSPGKPFDDFDIMLVHGQSLPLVVLARATLEVTAPGGPFGFTLCPGHAVAPIRARPLAVSRIA